MFKDNWKETFEIDELIKDISLTDKCELNDEEACIKVEKI